MSGEPLISIVAAEKVPIFDLSTVGVDLSAANASGKVDFIVLAIPAPHVAEAVTAVNNNVEFTCFGERDEVSFCCFHD